MQSHLQKILSEIPDYCKELILVCDENFKIIFANKLAINEFFSDEEDFKGKQIFEKLNFEIIGDNLDSLIEQLYIKGFYEGQVKKVKNEIEKKYLIKIHKHILNKEDNYFFIFIINDETSQRIIEEELRKSQDEIRSLVIYLQNAREEERAKIARELHDDLGQLLTLLKMDLQSIIISENLKIEDLKFKIKSSINYVDESINVTRKLISELRLAILDHLGLVAAIEHQIDEFRKRTGIEVVESLDESLNIDKEISISLFRIFQELLTNVSRHSGASKVLVDLKNDGSNLLMKVSDNGKGFDVSEIGKRNSFGLIGIRERIKILNGTFEIQSTEGMGTTVKIKIPIQKL